MGIFDLFKSKTGMNKAKAKNTADEASGVMNQAPGGVDEAREFTDDRTGGRFSDQTAQGVDIARQRMGTGDEAMRHDADQNG